MPRKGDAPASDTHHATSKNVHVASAPRKPGRVSEENLALVEEGFAEVLARAQSLADQTGLSVAQVFDLWHTSNEHRHTKPNWWNLYSAYFKNHEQEEMERLGRRQSSLWFTC